MTDQPEKKTPWKLLAGLGCLCLCCCSGLLTWALAEAGGLEALGNGAARVDCGTPGPGGVDCVVKRTAPGGGLRACWELEITCQNGAAMTASACGELPANTDGEQTTVNMPAASFSNQDGCDAPASGVVRQLVVEPRR